MSFIRKMAQTLKSNAICTFYLTIKERERHLKISRVVLRLLRYLRGKVGGSCGSAGGELQCHKALWCELWDKPLTGVFVLEPTSRFCRVVCVFILGLLIDFNDQFTLFKTTQTT